MMMMSFFSQLLLFVSAVNDFKIYTTNYYNESYYRIGNIQTTIFSQECFLLALEIITLLRRQTVYKYNSQPLT